MQIISQPDGTIRLGEYLTAHLQETEWSEFRAAIAFVKLSGVRHIATALAEFSRRAAVKISVGIDHGGTSMEGLRALLNALDGRGEVWVFHNETNSTFHPKVYFFKGENKADLLIGSGNLTEGGLFTNYEAALFTSLDLTDEADHAVLQQAEEALDKWSHLAPGTAVLLTHEKLDQLVANGDVPTEAETRKAIAAATKARKGEGEERDKKPSLFARIPIPKAPALPAAAAPRDTPDEPEDLNEEDFEVETFEPAPPQEGAYSGFLMTLQRTDVGVGQTTTGTSRRSPEIFIPLAARDYDTEFWGWPDEFTEDADRPGKMDRRGVRVRIGTEIVDVNMMTWPAKHDFRIRSESIRSAGNIGDILRLERADGAGGFSYYVEVIPQGTTRYDEYLALCVNEVRNSEKRWGYY